MEHSAYSVDVLDKTGKIIGSKLRREIDKQKDIFHTIYIFLITPRGELVLTPIVRRDDLPNLFTGKLSVPVTTIRRTHESAEQAAIRAAARELFIEEADVKLVGEGMCQFDTARRLCTVFFLVGEPPATYSKTDISKLITMSPREFFKRLGENTEDFAVSLRILWNRFQDKLPV